MPEAQQQIDTKALQLANEARTMITQHMQTCATQRAEDREDRAELWRALARQGRDYAGQIEGVHKRLDNGLKLLVVVAAASAGNLGKVLWELLKAMGG